MALSKIPSAGFSGTEGITIADQWRLDDHINGNHAPITNVERVDTAGQGTIGTAMSVSNGVFTFPSTGTYLVTFNSNWSRGFNDAIVNFVIKATTDGTNFVDVAYAFNNSGSFSGSYNTIEVKTLLNVNDTSLVKVRFDVASAESGSSNHLIHGVTSYNSTTFTFIRVGGST
tara:strand:- start:62 stop:577 length:516 start_codon:yes stop_codon:yes gene_type:complete